MAAKIHMQAAAESAETSACRIGVDIDVSSAVYANDGSRAWPSTLARALCESPELAQGSRDDMAKLITTRLSLSKPFQSQRLSRELSAKSRPVVREILSKHGYTSLGFTTGLGIRDAVRAGKGTPVSHERSISTRFEADGVWLGPYWYPYERVASYATDQPWYCLGLRFAGDLIPLKTVLAMRDFGISEFMELDALAMRASNADQMKRRAALIGG